MKNRKAVDVAAHRRSPKTRPAPEGLSEWLEKVTSGRLFEEARLGNPLLYARRVFIAIISSFFCQEYLPSYQNAPRNPYRLRCDEDGSVSTIAASSSPIDSVRKMSLDDPRS